MSARFWCWGKKGAGEVFFSGRQPSEEYAAALRRAGFEILSGTAYTPDWWDVSEGQVKVRMDRSLTPGSMPAVKSEGGE